jgi:peroxiredoxin
MSRKVGILKAPFRWRHIWTVFVVVAVVALGIVLGWHRPRSSTAVSSEADLPGQVATVNGVVITQEMLDRELKVSRLNVAAPLPPLTGEDLERAAEEALNQLIMRQLILQAASRNSFSLEKSFIDKRAELLFGNRSDVALMQALDKAGGTYNDILWWVGEIITVEEYTTQVVMAGATPEDRQQVYNEWLNSQRATAQISTYLSDEIQSSAALIGEPAPNFALINLEGDSVSLSDYEGKIVLVNFWATWCPSCISEMPDYEQVFQRHQADFVVLGINLQENGGHVQQYADGLGLTFPVLLDQDGRVTTRQYQVTGMPGSFIVDRQGDIYYRHVGPMNAETLNGKLAELGL